MIHRLVLLLGAGVLTKNGHVTYVPRQSAIERYRLARIERRAAVRRGYVDLVRDAFGRLGDHHLDEYERATPVPDVPVVDFESTRSG